MEAEFDAKIKLTTNYDMDQQYMAALDLAQLVEKYYQKMNQPLFVKVIDALLRLLEDQMESLHDCGTKCLIKIISKIPVQQCKRISETMIQKVKSPGTKEQLRNVYGNGIKTLISNISFEMGGHLSDLFKLTAQAILQGSSNSNIKIQQELIEIASAFLGKWPKVIQKVQFNRMALAKYLTNIIIKQYSTLIKKRAYLCLGQFSVNLKANQFKQILSNGLLPYLSNQQDIRDRKEAIHALSAILKSKSRNLQQFSRQLFDIFEQQIIKQKDRQDIGDDQQLADLVYELLEECLVCWNSLVVGFYKEVKDKINKKVIDILIQLVEYRPLYQIQYLQQNIMQIEGEEDMVYQEVVDLSNKVRKQTLILIGIISKLHSKTCDQFARVDSLYNTLKQKDIDVREASFSLFTGLFQGITIQQNLNKQQQDLFNLQQPKFKKVISSFKEQAPIILQRTLIKLIQLNKNSQIDENTRLNSVKLINHICKSFPAIITGNEHLLHLILDTIFDLFNKHNLHQNQINLMNALQRLLARGFYLKNSSKFIPLFLKQGNSNDDKITISSFKAISAYLNNFIEITKVVNSDLNNLFDLIIARFRNNYVLQVRTAIAQAVAQIIKSYHQIIDPEKNLKILAILTNKLSTDPDKKYLLAISSQLHQQLPLNKSLIQQLNKLGVFIAQNFLNHKDNSIKDSANMSMFKIISILKSNLQKSNAIKILTKGQVLFNSNQFPNFYLKLLNIYPDIFKSYLSVILQINNLPVEIIKHLINQKVIKNDQCLNILKNSLKKQNIENSIKLLVQLNYSEKNFQGQIGDTLWGRVSIGILGQIGNIKHFQTIRNIVYGNYSEQTKLIAGLALGGIAAKNFKMVVPQLVLDLSKIQQQQKYNIYLGIREAILKSNISNYKDILNIINTLVVQIAESKNQKQSILNIIAQCISKVITLSPIDCLPFIQNLAKSLKHNVRYIFVTSFSYLFKQPNIQLPQIVIDSHLSILISLLKDINLDVRAGVLKSLGVILFNNINILTSRLNEQVFNLIRGCCLFDKSFIVIMDYGIKISVDKGKAMRIEAFSLLQSLFQKQTSKVIEFLHIQTEIISSALQKLDQDPSEDVLIHRLTIIELITKKQPHAIIPLQKIFRGKLNNQTGKLKDYRIKKINEDGSIQRIVRSILRLVYRIYLNTKQQFSMQIQNFYNSLKTTPRFKQILESLEKEEN